MGIRKLIIAGLLALGLLGGQALSVGAWNGNTAASPETYKCTQINTTPGRLGPTGIAFGILFGRGESYITCYID